MADIGNLTFGVHLQDYTDAEANKIKKKLENLSVKLHIDAGSSTVTNTDAIKKQIESAVKSVTVSSVRFDANSVKQGLDSAVQGASPKVTVTLLRGNLVNDIQAYLDTKQFSIQVTISATQAQQTIAKTLANVSVPVNVKVSSSAVMQQLKQSLANKSVPISVRAADVNTFVKDLKTKLGNKAVKIDLDVNKNSFAQHVRDALKGKLFKADLKLTIKQASVQDAIKQAFAKAGMNYNTTASDVRAARVDEIRQRMALRAANANRQLARSYQEATGSAHSFARASLNLSNGLHTNIRLGGELGTVLGNVASLFGTQDIFRNIVQIGGQLENQRIALSAILQDGGKATSLFRQIQSLAVKSPFGIMDLNQYAKQLSAYGIAYNELYDTMKRLADISAGVGVDMGRIILAYGQVRAAGFLKGTELRQFTEANIPLVDELAKRFTKLRGEIVSAADVYEMISKKEIAFEDVKAVLDGLTEVGGRFHDMQEVLSESLASKWKNLADAIDVMLGKIADGAIGSGLKGVAELLTAITKQWEYVAAATLSAFTTFGVYKAAVVLGSKQMAAARGTYAFLMANKQQEAAMLRQEALYRKLTKAELALIATTGKLTNADVKAAVAAGTLNKKQALRLITLGKLDKAMLRGVQRTLQISNAEIVAAQNANILRRAWASMANGISALGVALKSLALNPMTWIFTAITAAAEVFAYFNKKASESKERVEELMRVANDGYKNISDTIRQFDESVPDTDFGMATRIEEIKKILKDSLPNFNQILNEVYKTDDKGNYINDLKTRYEMLTATLNDLRGAYKLLGADMKGVSDEANKSTDGLWDESLIKNIKDVVKQLDAYSSAASKLAANSTIFEEAVNAALGADAGYAEKYGNAPFYEQIKGLKDFTEAYKAFMEYAGKHNWEFASWINNFRDAFDGLTDATRVANKDINQFMLNYKASLMGRGFDFNNLTEKRRLAIVIDLTTFFKQIEGFSEETRRLLLDKTLEKEFNIKLNEEDWKYVEELTKPKKEYDASKDEVAKRWKKRTEEIGKAVKMYNDWKKVEGSLNAEQRVKGNEELSNLFNGAYGFTLDLEDPTAAYKYIQSQLNDKLSAQHDLRVELGVKLSDAELDDARDKLKRFVDNLKNDMKQATSQWDLYKQLFELTGDKEFAKTAFTNTQVWDDAALAMKEQFEAAIKEAGINAPANFSYSDEAAKLLFGDFYDSWKEIKDRIEKNGIDLKVNAGKAIQSTQSVAEQIKALENKRDEELKKYTKGTAEYDAKSKELENQIVKLKAELLELDPVFKDLFVDTTGMATSKIYDLWKQAHDLVALIRANTTRMDYDENGNIRGRYYTKADGTEGYISEEQFEKVDKVVNKLGKKVPDSITAFNNLWDAIRGKGKEDYGFKEIANDVSILSKEIASSADALSGMFDALGKDDLADGFAFAADMLNGVSNIAAGIASNNPFAVINGVAGIVTSIAGFHDKKLDKQIQKSQLEVKKLENAYKAVERVVSRQLGSVAKAQSDEMLKNLQSQRDEIEKQMQLEEDKKKTDKSKIEDYKAQMAELDDQIKHFYEDLAKEQYGVDIKDFAEQISSSLVDAFAAGEDAAEAFDKTVSEILKGLVKDMIKFQVIEPALKGLKNYLFDKNGGVFTANSAGGTDLTTGEAAGLVQEMGKVKGALSEAEKIWNTLNEELDGMLETTEAANDSLSGNIKSVTEDTAQLLASYLNAMRQDLSVNRKLFDKLVNDDIQRMSLIAQAQLQQLSMIQQNTLRNADAADRIYDLVNRVVDKGGNKLKI